MAEVETVGVEENEADSVPVRSSAEPASLDGQGTVDHQLQMHDRAQDVGACSPYRADGSYPLRGSLLLYHPKDAQRVMMARSTVVANSSSMPCS